MTVVNIADARADRMADVTYRTRLCTQLATDLDELVDDLNGARRRVSRAKTFGKALEHYARALRRYHEFKGCLLASVHLKHPIVLAYMPPHLVGEAFIVRSQVALIEQALASQKPWMCASGLRNFKWAAISVLHMAVMLATEGARASRAVAAEPKGKLEVAR